MQKQLLKEKVFIEDGRILIKEIEIFDEDLATYLREFKENEQPEIIKKAIKIGLIALKDSVTTGKIDYVEKEFYRLNEKLSKNLDSHFKGKDSEIFKLLDHTDPESPVALLKQDLIDNYLQSMRDKLIGRAAQLRGPGVGRDYEYIVFDNISEICKPFSDIPVLTGSKTGKVPRSKVGDVVVTINPKSTGEIPLRIVFEAKDRGSYNVPTIKDELNEAKKNRDAAVAIMVFSGETCPHACQPFQQYGDDKIVCVCNEYDHDFLGLNLAYRIARIAALESLRGKPPTIDKEQMRTIISECTNKLKAISSIKSKVTRLASDVNSDLDTFRDELLTMLNKLDEITK